MDTDLWWHIKIGEYLVNNFTLKPDHSLFSWTVADPNWVYNGWLPQILLFVVYKIGDIYGLYFFQYGVILGSVFILLYYAYILKVKLPFILYLGAILAFLTAAHLNIALLRPEIFSYILLIFIVFAYFYSITTEKSLFWLYPIIMLIWVNSHGVFIFGIVFILVTLVAEALQYHLSKYYKFIEKPITKTKLYLLSVFVTLSLLTLIITPYGDKWIMSIIKHFTDTQFMRQAEFLAAYQSVFLFDHPAKYLLIGFVLIYVVLTIYLIYVKKKINFAILIVNIVFIYFSFMYGRSAYYYLPVWYFSILYITNLLFDTSIENQNSLFKFLTPIATVFFILASSYIIYWVSYYPLMYRYVGVGVGEYFPEKCTDFLIQNKLEGPIFNTYEVGGYLIFRLYPHYKVFIDPRHGPYAKHLMDEYKVFEKGGNFDAFTTKYSFKTAIVQIRFTHLITHFVKSNKWRLVYFDQSSAVFIHNSVKGPDILNDLGPERFNSLRSYEAHIYAMYVYLMINDFKSAWYLVDLLKQKYYYGRYKERIDITIENIKKYESQGGLLIRNE